MAFVAANLNAAYSLRAKSQGTQTWKYDGGSDTVATIVAADYFLGEFLKLSVGDFINVIHDAGTTVLEVLTSAVGGVTTTEHGKGIVACGAALTLTQALHDGKTILWDTAAGSIATLPAATGTGAIYRCVVSVLATSNNHEIKCAGTDEFVGTYGIIDSDTGDATILFAALVGDNFDRMVLNRTTTGIAGPGDWVEVQDIITGSWAIQGAATATGTVATPFIST